MAKGGNFPVFGFLRNRQAARACARKDLKRLVRALARGADPNAIGRRCERGYRGQYEHLIHMTVSLQWPEGLAALLEAGADTELRGGIDNGTVFFQACEAQQDTIMAMLAKHGADPDGLGWAIDRKALDEIMEIVGWDYPSQSALVTAREMTAQELVDYRRNPEQLAILHMARERHRAFSCNAALEQKTPAAQRRARAPRL